MLIKNIVIALYYIGIVLVIFGYSKYQSLSIQFVGVGIFFSGVMLSVFNRYYKTNDNHSNSLNSNIKHNFHRHKQQSTIEKFIQFFLCSALFPLFMSICFTMYGVILSFVTNNASLTRWFSSFGIIYVFLVMSFYMYILLFIPAIILVFLLEILPKTYYKIYTVILGVSLAFCLYEFNFSSMFRSSGEYFPNMEISFWCIFVSSLLSTIMLSFVLHRLNEKD